MGATKTGLWWRGDGELYSHIDEERQWLSSEDQKINCKLSQIRDERFYAKPNAQLLCKWSAFIRRGEKLREKPLQ